MTHTIVVGTTEPQDFALFDDAEALVGTSWDVGLEFRETVSGPAVAWISAAAGTARVTGLDGLTAGIYHFRFTLTDGVEVAYVPSELIDAITLRVIPV